MHNSAHLLSSWNIIGTFSSRAILILRFHIAFISVVSCATFVSFARFCKHSDQTRQKPELCCRLLLLTDVLQFSPWMDLDTRELYFRGSALNTVCVCLHWGSRELLIFWTAEASTFVTSGWRFSEGSLKFESRTTRGSNKHCVQLNKTSTTSQTNKQTKNDIYQKMLLNSARMRPGDLTACILAYSTGMLLWW